MVWGRSGRVVAWGRGAVCAGMGWGSITGETKQVFFSLSVFTAQEKRAPVMPGDMSSSGAAGLAEPYLIYRKEDSIVDGRRLVPRKTRGWLRQRDVDIEKRRRIQHSAAAGGRRVSLEERMRSRRRALDEAWTKRAGRTNGWHRVLVGTSKGSPVRGAAWRVSGFWSTAKAGRWLHTTKSWERPGLNRIWCAAGEVSLRGAGADHRCIEPRPTYSGRRIDWAREEPELKRGLDLFFFLLAVKVWMPGQTECHLVPVRSQFANGPPPTASPSSAMFFNFLIF